MGVYPQLLTGPIPILSFSPTTYLTGSSVVRYVAYQPPRATPLASKRQTGGVRALNPAADQRAALSGPRSRSDTVPMTRRVRRTHSVSSGGRERHALRASDDHREVSIPLVTGHDRQERQQRHRAAAELGGVR